MKGLYLSNGSVETLKWIALFLMLLDHVNKYLFMGSLPAAFELGRLCLPLFTVLLAYNLARPGVIESGACQRIISRLAVFGAISTVPFVALGGLIGDWWPLNVLFTLLATTLVIYLASKGGTTNYLLAGSAGLIAGGLVEFWWPAIILGVFIWVYFKTGSTTAMGIAVAACGSLYFVNGNHWALLVIPCLITASSLRFQLPRMKWFFYAFYPIHLTVIFVIKLQMIKKGYLFLV